jgi:P27 family predicted phage terminase small subunit
MNTKPKTATNNFRSPKPTKAPRPRPPQHLREQTRKWWAAIVDEYELESHHLRLLSLACAAWDRASAAREVIDADGAVYQDRFGQPKARPEVAIERNSMIAFARLMRELSLDAGDAPAEVRPPRLAGTGS